LEYERCSIEGYNVPLIHNLLKNRYIEEDMDFESRRASSKEHALAMFAGYKFEAISTLDKTWDESTRYEIEHRHENIVDNIQQYCSIVKTQLGSSTIIMGGEVDCLWGITFSLKTIVNTGRLQT
jgi:hypothetical protein